MMARPMSTNEPQFECDSSHDDTVTEAFVAQLMEHRHRLYAFIAKQLVYAPDVEDIFQKTSVVLWRKMEQFDATKRFFSWACGIAFNEVRNFLTTQRRSRLHFDAELVELLAAEAQEEEELSEARLQALRACVGHLPDRQQRILQDCYGGSTTVSEVANGLGRSRDALYKQLARLRQRLLDCIRGRLAREGVGQ